MEGDDRRRVDIFGVEFGFDGDGVEVGFGKRMRERVAMILR